MKLRIGIDFDNTIACYDKVFFAVASRLGYLGREAGSLTKNQVKEIIISRPNGEIEWQKLQGQVYGKFMSFASLASGFFEFLCLSKIRGNQIFIVSHKSEYGHFDENKILLREVALNWLKLNKLIESGLFSFKKEHIFFESTQKSKIDKIYQLECTHFIDDLPEILENDDFPKNTQKIFYNLHHIDASVKQMQIEHSWRGISQYLYGDWSEEEISLVIQKLFPFLGIEKACLINGGGNSRVYKLVNLKTNENLALKIYPDRQVDQRSRLKDEFSACSTLHELGFSVAKAREKNDNLNWAIYEWVAGEPIQVGTNFLNEAALFVERLFAASSVVDYRNFPIASEACLSGKEIIRQLEERLSFLKKIKILELQQFLETEFREAKDFAEQSSRYKIGYLFDINLNFYQQTLSPSDFGAHNALKKESNEILFIDFEYFGWDDPVKLVSDFYWHPAMELNHDMKQYWLQISKRIFNKDLFFENRLMAHLPLFGLRWCLILLNEFLPDRFARRAQANQGKFMNYQSVLSSQLCKAKNLLKTIRELNGYSI